MSDLLYSTMHSPIGDLLLVVTPKGLLRVAFEKDDYELVLSNIENIFGQPPRRSPSATKKASHELAQYFAGKRTKFTTPLDFSLSRGFRQIVQKSLLRVPYAKTLSYKDLAAISGSDMAYRAVGTACSTNPLPIVVPCHRVINANGTIGRYGGGEHAKEWLLALEKNNKK
jgi:methylated-DNA-[protein]-cysteine S-methyltransferase